MKCVEDLSMRDGWYLANGNKPLFVDRSAKNNDFSSALHEGGIAGVAQGEDEQDDNNDEENRKTNEDPDNPPIISLERTTSCGKILGVPSLENPVELSGVEPPENPVKLPGVDSPEKKVHDNVLTPLFPSEYDSNDESDDKDEDTYMSTQKLQRFIHPEAMPPTASNIYNLRPRKHTDYVKENIYQSMPFAQVCIDLNKDALLSLQNKVM